MTKHEIILNLSALERLLDKLGIEPAEIGSRNCLLISSYLGKTEDMEIPRQYLLSLYKGNYN